MWPQFTHHFSLMTTAAAAATTIITFSPSDLCHFHWTLTSYCPPAPLSLSLSGSNFSPYWPYCHLGLMYFIYFISIRETKKRYRFMQFSLCSFETISKITCQGNLLHGFDIFTFCLWKIWNFFFFLCQINYTCLWKDFWKFTFFWL